MIKTPHPLSLDLQRKQLHFALCSQIEGKLCLPIGLPSFKGRPYASADPISLLAKIEEMPGNNISCQEHKRGPRSFILSVLVHNFRLAFRDYL